MKATRKLPFLLSLRHFQDTQSADGDADILKSCKVGTVVFTMQNFWNPYVCIFKRNPIVSIHIQSIGQHSALH